MVQIVIAAGGLLAVLRVGRTAGARHCRYCHTKITHAEANHLALCVACERTLVWARRQVDALRR